MKSILIITLAVALCTYIFAIAGLVAWGVATIILCLGILAGGLDD